jgi:hypothetical protein
MDFTIQVKSVQVAKKHLATDIEKFAQCNDVCNDCNSYLFGVRRDSSYIFLTVKRTVKLLTFRLCVLNVLLVNVISI